MLDHTDAAKTANSVSKRQEATQSGSGARETLALSELARLPTIRQIGLGFFHSGRKGALAMRQGERMRPKVQAEIGSGRRLEHSGRRSRST